MPNLALVEKKRVNIFILFLKKSFIFKILVIFLTYLMFLNKYFNSQKNYKWYFVETDI